MATRCDCRTGAWGSHCRLWLERCFLFPQRALQRGRCFMGKMSGKKHPVTWQLEHLCVQCVIAHNYINGLKEHGPYPSARGKAHCL